MEEQTDKVFIKNISIVLTILVVLTISIAFISREIGFEQEQDNNPSRNLISEERIKAVAGAYTNETEVAPSAAPVTSAAPEKTLAFDGSLDSEIIYASVCATCHATGVAGAPKPGSPEMTQRSEKGLDALMQTALNGLNAMPARGGRADLSDEQVRAVVEYMLR